MMTKSKATMANPVAPTREVRELWPSAPASLADRVQRIETMGLRINNYIQFICKAASLTVTSVEAKDRGVTAFYERMLVVERQLRRIQEDLWLE